LIHTCKCCTPLIARSESYLCRRKKLKLLALSKENHKKFEHISRELADFKIELEITQVAKMNAIESSHRPNEIHIPDVAPLLLEPMWSHLVGEVELDKLFEGTEE